MQSCTELYILGQGKFLLVNHPLHFPITYFWIQHHPPMRRSLANLWSIWFLCNRSETLLWGRHLSKNLDLTSSGTQTMPHGIRTWECTAGPAQFLAPVSLNPATTRPALETQHQPLQITQCTMWRSQIQVISYLRTVKVMIIDIMLTTKCRRIGDLSIAGSSLHLQCCPDSWAVGATGPLIPPWVLTTPSPSSNVPGSLKQLAGWGFTHHSDNMV